MESLIRGIEERKEEGRSEGESGNCSIKGGKGGEEWGVAF